MIDAAPNPLARTVPVSHGDNGKQRQKTAWPHGIASDFHAAANVPFEHASSQQDLACEYAEASEAASPARMY